MLSLLTREIRRRHQLSDTSHCERSLATVDSGGAQVEPERRTHSASFLQPRGVHALCMERNDLSIVTTALWRGRLDGDGDGGTSVVRNLQVDSEVAVYGNFVPTGSQQPAGAHQAH